MTTDRRPWPNAAKHARDDAADDLVNAAKHLDRFTEEYPRIDDASRILLVSRANNRIKRALRLLESVGAQTKP